MAVKSGLPAWVFVASLFGAHGAVLAQSSEPLSAIDWLSNSVDVPGEAPNTTDAAPAAEMPSLITVLPLDTASPDSAGLRPASDLNLDEGLWGRSSASDLATLLNDLPDGAEAPPAINRFLVELLTLEFEPPIDAAIDDSFFLARVDRLLSMGQLGLAAALIEKAGVTEAEGFRRAFDIALLQGSETETCGAIEDTPELSPTYPARIFCLARLGEWDVAALTFGNAEALGILSEDENLLLLHFLDAEYSEGNPIPSAPRVPSPLIFRLYEAVGERIPTDQLPVAFAYADLETTVGWQARLRAVERLVAAGALPFEQLVEVFEEREPAASGGVFDRVAAFQEFKDLLERRNSRNLGKALSEAWFAAGRAGYDTAFAEWVTPSLVGLNLGDGAGHQAFEIALRASRPDIAQAFAVDTPEDRFLLATATGQGGATPGSSLLNQAVARGLVALSAGPTFEALLRGDQKGEALFRALQHLKRGAGGNPQTTQHALTVLRKLGLTGLARQVAVELILMDGAA